MKGSDQHHGIRSSLARAPGIVVLGGWLVLLVGAVAVAEFVSAREVAKAHAARLRPSPVERLERVRAERAVRESRAVDSARLAALQAARDEFERADQTELRMRARALAAAVAWLLAFAFASVGTVWWVTAKDGWSRIQSWHGGKLLMLYVGFVPAAFAYATAVLVARSTVAGRSLLVAGALLLMAGGAMLFRATWNWLTGRERPRRHLTMPSDNAAREPLGIPAGTAALQHTGVQAFLRSLRRPSAVALLLLAVGLAVGAVAGYLIARQPRTYADCVLSGMRHASTATAVEVLDAACRRKFSR